jgi:hypothetical protein
LFDFAAKLQKIPHSTKSTEDNFSKKILILGYIGLGEGEYKNFTILPKIF